MDPTSWISKLDQSVKAMLILAAGASVCIGFFLKLISQEQFMPFVYTVIGAAFARTMSGGMSAFSKTEETGADGVKRTTTTSTPPSIPPPASAAPAPTLPTPTPTSTPVVSATNAVDTKVTTTDVGGLVR